MYDRDVMSGRRAYRAVASSVQPSFPPSHLSVDDVGCMIVRCLGRTATVGCFCDVLLGGLFDLEDGVVDAG